MMAYTTSYTQISRSHTHSTFRGRLLHSTYLSLLRVSSFALPSFLSLRGCRAGGCRRGVIHDRGGRNAYEHHMSFQLHAFHTHTHTHVHTRGDRCGATGEDVALKEALVIVGTGLSSFAPSHHWRLCGHGLIYELLYGNRRAITFSHCGGTELERAQTHSVFCQNCQKRALTPICHRIRNIQPINYPKTVWCHVLKGQFTTVSGHADLFLVYFVQDQDGNRSDSRLVPDVVYLQ